jgi:hypothetical protein
MASVYVEVSIDASGAGNVDVRPVAGSDAVAHIREALMTAAQSQKGTAEELTALSVALLRGLGCVVRYVAVLDGHPQKTSLRAAGEAAPDAT